MTVIRWSNKIFSTCFSIILDAASSIDIGLYPDLIFLSLPGLGIGVILAVFHSCSTLTVESDELRRLESGNAVLQAVCFNIFADTPSHPGPVDLLVSRAVNSSYTDSSVESSCFGQFSGGKFCSTAIGNSYSEGKL